MSTNTDIISLLFWLKLSGTKKRIKILQKMVYKISEYKCFNNMQNTLSNQYIVYTYNHSPLFPNTGIPILLYCLDF
jgi:hypothetical protein